MRDNAYLTKVEAADYLRISRSNLETYIPEIPHFRLGNKQKGKVIFRRTDLDRWVENYRVEGRISKSEVDELLEEIQRKA